MPSFLNLFKAVIYGIVEGITEWLPISSTGHLILLERVLPLDMPEAFLNAFRVIIQLGAILAVFVIYWEKLWPWKRSARDGEIYCSKQVVRLWELMILACVPAGIVGVLVDDWVEEHFYSPLEVSLALIIVGILFIVVENRLAGQRPQVTDVRNLSWQTAFYIGCFQVLAACFPGVSRSGATILGGLLLGVSRAVAAEFTFYLGIPVMCGASLLKILQLDYSPGAEEWVMLLVAMLTAYLVSMKCIHFLMGYVKKHDFKGFGVYRICLGLLVLLCLVA